MPAHCHLFPIFFFQCYLVDRQDDGREIAFGHCQYRMILRYLNCPALVPGVFLVAVFNLRVAYFGQYRAFSVMACFDP